jgi:hypothetical protein
MMTEAREVEQAATVALYRDGRSLFASDEHDRRVKAIEGERRQAVDMVLDEVKRRSNEIHAALLPTDTDPVAVLGTDDLTRAAALAPFVKDDVAAGTFAAKLRAVVRSGDAASRAVWYRTLAAVDPDSRRTWDAETHDLFSELERIVRPVDPQQEQLKATQAELRSIENGVMLSGYLERTYGRR